MVFPFHPYCIVHYSHSHFKNIIPFTLNVLFSQGIHIPLFDSTLYVFVTERGFCFLTRAVVVITTHSFKNSIAMSAETINMEAINFFLSPCREETLNFTVNSVALIVRHNHVLKTSSFVLSRFEFFEFLGLG